jgi:hypothetical protein
MGEPLARAPLDRALDLRPDLPLVFPLVLRLDLAVDRALDLCDDDVLFDPARLRAPLEARLPLRDAAPPFEPRDPDAPDRPRFCVLFFDDVLRVRVAFMACLFKKNSFDGATRGLRLRSDDAKSMPWLRSMRSVRDAASQRAQHASDAPAAARARAGGAAPNPPRKNYRPE